MSWLVRFCCCIVLVALTACGSSSTAFTPPPVDEDLPPVISAVTPPGGATGAEIQFRATASGSPTAWQWTLGGGAWPQTSTEATPTVTLVTPGTFTASVVATNAFGNSAPFAFTYTVMANQLAPRVLAITPSGRVGGVGTPATFEVLATNAPTGWEWDFGGAALPNESTVASPQVTLGAFGVYTLTVSARNAHGVSPPFTAEIRVGIPEAPLQYSNFPRSNDVFDVVTLDGSVFVAFAGPPEGFITLLTSRTATPAVDGWDQSIIATASPFQETLSLAVIDSRLAIAYTTDNSSDPEVRYGRATTMRPSAPTDWDIWTVASGVSCVRNALVDLHGKPALTFDADGHASVAVSLHENPAGTSDWRITQLATNLWLKSVAAIVYRDRLAVTFVDREAVIQVAQAQVEAPEFFIQWQVHPVDSGLLQGDWTLPKLLVEGDHLLLIQNLDGTIELLRSTVPVPATAAHWERTVLPVNAFAVDAAIVDDRLLLSYFESGVNRTVISRAWSPLATSNDFDWVFLEGVNASVPTAVAALDGRPFVCYFASLPSSAPGDSDLVIAEARDPW